MGDFKFEVWPTEFRVITQHFGANPRNYAQFGLPGHDGLDIRAPTGSKIFSVAPGEVVRVHEKPTGHNYGIHVRILHQDGYKTIYAHLQKALVRKIMQEKMQEKQRLANEEVQKQITLQLEKAEDAKQHEEQQRVVNQKLAQAREKQEAERLARIEAEKKEEQERVKAIEIEKEKERARMAEEEARKKAEADRMAQAERNKIAAQKQHDIQTVEKHKRAAEVHHQAGRFLEARKGYEAALAFIRSSRFRNESELTGQRKRIESILAADDMVYGSKGYVLYKGEWLSPGELELKRYSEGFVKYKGEFRDHRTLKNTINKLCDPLIQKHLTKKYSGKTVHSKNIYFQKMVLTRNNADFSQYTVYYKWSVSTFKGMDEDICTLDIKYTVDPGKWSLLKGCE